MKDRRAGAGAGVFPFSLGCMSQSAVAVADPSDKKPPPPQQQQNDPSPSSSAAGAATHAAEDGGEKARGAAAGVVAAGVQRLIRGIKSLTQIMFAADYVEEEEEDEEEEEREMVIGFPTDVQHVGHIGWEGLSKVGGAMDMVNAFSLPSSLSLRQLEAAMEAAHA